MPFVDIFSVFAWLSVALLGDSKTDKEINFNKMKTFKSHEPIFDSQ